MEENLRKAWTSAVQCIEKGDVATLDKILEENPALLFASQDETGRSLLHLASSAGKLDVIDALFLNGQPWNAVDSAGKSAGEYALDAGQKAAYTRLLQEGVRAELILAAVDQGEGKSQSAKTMLRP